MIDRDEALRILGLPASASESEIRDSWRLVRDHVRARAAASTAEEFQSGRESELRELADAVGQLTKDAAAELEGSDGRSKRRRWLIAWAAVATLVAVVSLTFLAMSDGARGPAVLVDGAGDGGSSFGEGVG